MLIRNAELTDLPAIVTIYNASIGDRMATADTEPVSINSRMAWFHDHSPSQRPLWVVEIDAAMGAGRTTAGIAGWLGFQSFYGRPAYHATAEISIYIAPEYQRRGLAKKLLNQAINHSPQLGLNTLLGFIFAHNQPSLLLFASCGFHTWGHLPKVAELDCIERDLIIMGRKINQNS